MKEKINIERETKNVFLGTNSELKIILKYYSRRFSLSIMKKTTGAQKVPGLNPASPTLILMRCRINVSKCRKYEGSEGKGLAGWLTTCLFCLIW